MTDIEMWHWRWFCGCGEDNADWRRKPELCSFCGGEIGFTRRKARWVYGATCWWKPWTWFGASGWWEEMDEDRNVHVLSFNGKEAQG